MVHPVQTKFRFWFSTTLKSAKPFSKLTQTMCRDSKPADYKEWQT